MHEAIKLLESGTTIKFKTHSNIYTLKKIGDGMAGCDCIKPTGRLSPHAYNTIDFAFREGTWVLIDTKKMDHIKKIKQYA